MQAVNALTDRLGEPQLDAFRPRMCERPRGNSYQFGAYVPHRYSMDDGLDHPVQRPHFLAVQMWFPMWWIPKILASNFRIDW